SLAGQPLGLHPFPPPLAGKGMGGGIAPLLDRLGNKLGLGALSRLEPRESHIPERASVRVTPSPTQPRRLGPPSPALRERVLSVAKGLRASQDGEGLKPPRPIRLFEPPEPVE